MNNIECIVKKIAYLFYVHFSSCEVPIVKADQLVAFKWAVELLSDYDATVWPTLHAMLYCADWIAVKTEKYQNQTKTT